MTLSNQLVGRKASQAEISTSICGRRARWGGTGTGATPPSEVCHQELRQKQEADLERTAQVSHIWSAEELPFDELIVEFAATDH